MLFCAFFGTAASVVGQESTVIRDVGVFDGDTMLDQTSVLLRGDLIAEVGPDVSAPERSRIIEGRGMTLLPGLIDAHTHTTEVAQLRDALKFGVTTQIDMGTQPEKAAAWRSPPDSVPHDRADLISPGIPATAPGGHGTQFGWDIPTVASPAEAEEFVAHQAAAGADFLKIIIDDGSAYGVRIPTLKSETVAALVQAARAHGLRVWVHVATLKGARKAIAAGADGLAHVWLDSVPPEEFVTELARRHVVVIPTLRAMESVSPGSAATDRRLRTVRRLSQGGVILLAGSDAPNPGTRHGATIHSEMEALVSAGLSTRAVLSGATARAADTFGLSDRGYVRPGYLADLILVGGDPMQDIRETRNISRIWKAGTEIQPAEWSATSHEIKPATSDRDPGRLVSDFDDGDMMTSFGSPWIVTSDRLMGGSSTAELAVTDDGAVGTGGALLIRGSIATGAPFVFAGAMFFPGERPMQPVDLSAVHGIRYWVRGTPGAYRALVFRPEAGPAPAIAEFPIESDWKLVTINWGDFGLASGQDIGAIGIVAGPNTGEFSISVDQVELW
jgi:imidazolonepropionase-like amidohydrolase